MKKLIPGVVVHGGAGHFPDARVDPAVAGCRFATERALSVLATGGTAIEAVLVATRILEEDPTFNAGVGAVLSRHGTFEFDAAIMDGSDLRIGAIAAMPNIRQAIDVANAVMEDGEHVLLCGEPAWEFAREKGFAPCDPQELTTARAEERLAAIRSAREAGDLETVDPGTVGACAIDRFGHTAVATSTGGMTYKRPGRVGDTPLSGCGTYADDRAGAASATGLGEGIIRVTMARHCVDGMRSGGGAGPAARASVVELQSRVAGEGGIICCDARGRLGAAHNSERMAWAAALVGGPIVADIEVAEGTDIMDILVAAQGA